MASQCLSIASERVELKCTVTSTKAGRKSCAQRRCQYLMFNVIHEGSLIIQVAYGGKGPFNTYELIADQE
eukprot:5816333-Pleurochrysis_carterae.AAC.2